MNALEHAIASQKRRGGKVDDYLELHQFMDKSKEVISFNTHRCLTHHHFFILNVVLPIFGHYITNSDGKQVSVKDICEQDHVFLDYRSKFVPSLNDYVSLLPNDTAMRKLCEAMIKQVRGSLDGTLGGQIIGLMDKPLHITGNFKSLMLTYNSWFIGEILPLVFKGFIPTALGMSASVLLETCSNPGWINNGNGTPPSMEKFKAKKEAPIVDLAKNSCFDGTNVVPSPIDVKPPKWPYPEVKDQLID